MKMLVVDDDPAALDLAAYLLRAAGHEVTTASSGAAALRAVHGERPDVVAADLRMPGAIDGLQLVRLLRHDPALVDIRTVAVTANATPSTSEHAARNAGFDAYIHKPIEPETFASIIAGGAVGAPA